MSGGAEFQGRVVTWLVVHLLAEADAPDLFGLSSPIAWVICEANTAVDDVVVVFENGGVAFLQAKRTVNLSRPNRAPAAPKQLPFTSAIDQFVRQYLAGISVPGAPHRDFDLSRDRLILGVGVETGMPVRKALKTVLERLYLHPVGSPLADVAKNAEEENALSRLLENVRFSWERVQNRMPADSEILEFLRFVRVEVLFVETGEPGEQNAESLLRTSILVEPRQAGTVWGTLYTQCHSMMTARGSTDRAGALRMLLPQIRVKAARSYQADIDQLRTHSQRVLSRMEEFAHIDLDGVRVVLNRAHPAVVRSAAESGPLLIVGRPGAGKSGVQYQTILALGTEGRDFVVLAAEDHSATSLAALRSELGLEHDVADVLAHWPGAEPAFLFVDALDAARDDHVVRVLRDLIRGVSSGGSRWHVVASIREFDLRYSSEFQRLFRGPPVYTDSAPLQEPGLRNVRHMVVGGLSNAELAQLATAAPRLYNLVESAPTQLRDLLANPFNLRLAAALLDSGYAPEEVSALPTQMALLDAFWRVRVIEAGTSALRTARAAVLRNAVEEMISRRSLRASRQRVAGAAESPALQELLAAHVLAEWQRRPDRAPEDSTLVFTHNRIFDYAVERVYLREDRLSERLAADSQLGLWARPSLEMHFEYLWDLDNAPHAEFWFEVLATCAHPQVRAIDMLVGPGVAAARARTLNDLEPLLDALEGSDEATREAAERAFAYLLRAVQFALGDSSPLVGPEAGPWAAVIERVSRRLTRRASYTLKSVLYGAADQRASTTKSQFEDLGTAARRLLAYVWDLDPRDSHLVRAGIDAVVTFFASAPAESATLLRQGLSPDHLARYGFEEIRCYDKKIANLVEQDPEFVRDLYAAAFSLEPPPATPTAFGGPIMSFRSNAAQDLGISLYGLAREFPRFVSRAPEHAAASLIPVVEFHGEHAMTNRPPEEGSFSFMGSVAHFRADYTELWRSGRNADEVKKLLNHLEAYLVGLADEPDGLDTFRRVLEVLVRENRRASLWKVLLRAGARAPTTFGAELKPLLWTPVLLGGVDTKGAAADFLTAMAPALTEAERERVEAAILAVDEPDLRELGIASGRLRMGLLTRLGGEPITDEGRALLAKHAENDDTENFGAGPYAGASAVDPGEQEILASEEVDRDTTEDQRVLQLSSTAKEIKQALGLVGPDGDAARERAPEILRNLRDALREAVDEVHPTVREEGYTRLVGLCVGIADLNRHSFEPGTTALVREVLLEASSHPSPEADDPEEVRGLDWPVLLSGQTRGSAAEGLVVFYDQPSNDGEVANAVERLATDLTLSVRIHIVRGLNVFVRAFPDVAWRIAEDRAHSEEVPGAVYALMSTLGHLASSDPARVAALAICAHKRMAGRTGAPQAQGKCISLLTRLYALHNDDEAREYLYAVLDRPEQYAVEATHLVSAFRNGVLTQGSVSPPDRDASAVRARCFDLLTRLARVAVERFLELRDGPILDIEEDRDALLERLQPLVEILDGLGRQLYVAAGADGSDRPRPSEEVQERLYRESAPVIEALARAGIASLVHHLIETLEVLVPIDPRGAFLRISTAVLNGARDGYPYDSMAEEVIVRVIERYFADYRPLFEAHDDCRLALIDLLDTFVKAGSVRAAQITYGLGQLFR